MDTKRLFEILNETTAEFRHGPEKTTEEKDGYEVINVYAMPHVSQANEELEKVDCHFIVVGVDKEKAKQYREELIDILKTYPQLDRLMGGPSYIEVGGEIGSQDGALRLFALGKVLKFWDVIIPASLGFTGAEADSLAGRGYVMISGFSLSRMKEMQNENKREHL